MDLFPSRYRVKASKALSLATRKNTTECTRQTRTHGSSVVAGVRINNNAASRKLPEIPRISTSPRYLLSTFETSLYLSYEPGQKRGSIDPESSRISPIENISMYVSRDRERKIGTARADRKNVVLRGVHKWCRCVCVCVRGRTSEREASGGSAGFQ